MRFAILMAAVLAAPAVAEGRDVRPSISVTGVGSVKTPPDVATIGYDLVGEGRTSDEASQQLATKNRALVDQLVALLGRDAQATSGQVSMTQTRSRECQGNGNYYGQSQLSEGACAVTGYIVSLNGQVRTRAVEKAGTAVGLAGRLGARNARIDGFALVDRPAAQQRATAAALADAKQRAQAAADGAGVRLGSILSIGDQSGDDGRVFIPITVSASAPPPPPPPPPPVAIDIKPQPIETQARVYVRYAIGG
ncbi:hypothetical protein GGQ80_001059 [Sphingomonas jinjuensis]|uniref:DUF541 domain-containing protein n=1 Tax=Sphingomonas jinjuensis TaxID=535907 RepID=A0A840F9B0_9SPHN|nr:SIMPL domain-containing protein [Sphingomonas jinjuensis]MBB4153171.1 hypothetical protein [Sphingomonas jinjuensis]